MLGRFRPACAGLLLSALVTFAAAADGPIRLPVAPVVPTPMPAPVPPGGSLSLTGGQWYVIECDVKCAVRSYPRGMVKVTEEAGPLRLKGVFAGGGKVETRTYKGPVLYVVEATGKGAVDLEIVPFGFKSDAEIVGTSLQVDAAAGECPPPKVEPKTDPKVDPKTEAPISVPGFRVLIVYESGDASKMPPQQQNILYGKTVRDFLQANCVTGPDGKTKEFRIFDQDILGDAKVWQDAMKRKRDALPWVIISNGKTGYEGPLPATPDEFLTLANKYTEGK